MGYWNGWSNFAEWALVNEYTKQCKCCNEKFYPKSPNQKYCSREDSPECDDNRHYQALWDKNKHPLQKGETK